jgi:hypothetical protein
MSSTDVHRTPKHSHAHMASIRLAIKTTDFHTLNEPNPLIRPKPSSTTTGMVVLCFRHVLIEEGRNEHTLVVRNKMVFEEVPTYLVFRRVANYFRVLSVS